MPQETQLRYGTRTDVAESIPNQAYERAVDAMWREIAKRGFKRDDPQLWFKLALQMLAENVPEIRKLTRRKSGRKATNRTKTAAWNRSLILASVIGVQREASKQGQKLSDESACKQLSQRWQKWHKRAPRDPTARWLAARSVNTLRSDLTHARKETRADLSTALRVEFMSPLLGRLWLLNADVKDGLD